jgi:exodeoxyribonuclease VII small subunit
MTTGNANGVHGSNAAGFEDSYARLQEVVQKLNDGNLSLQEALAAFEEGMGLAERCLVLLDQAELRVQQVTAAAARPDAGAFGSAEGGPSAVPDDPEIGDIGAIFADGPFEVPAPPGGNLAYGRLPGEGRGVGKRGAPRGGLRPLPGAPKTDERASDLELDPLFDEDD